MNVLLLNQRKEFFCRSVEFWMLFWRELNAANACIGSGCFVDTTRIPDFISPLIENTINYPPRIFRLYQTYFVHQNPIAIFFFNINDRKMVPQHTYSNEYIVDDCTKNKHYLKNVYVMNLVFNQYKIL